MAHATLTAVDDQLEVLLSQTQNISVDISSGEVTLERYRPGFEEWKTIETYTASKEDLLYTSSRSTKHRLRMTTAGSATVEIW